MAGRPPGKADGRQRLIDACWELLIDSEPGERLTIAQVCEQAGVTPPTLYHHFGDLAALEVEASRQAFRRWNAEVAKDLAQIADPDERLRTHGRAYVAWARQHPDAYAIMFCRPASEGPSLAGPGLSLLVGNLAEVHGMAPDDARLIPIALAQWSMAHGLASLQSSVEGLDQDVVEGVLDFVTDLTGQHDPRSAPDWAERIRNFRSQAMQTATAPQRRRRRGGGFR